jgi:hypothetical protein
MLAAELPLRNLVEEYLPVDIWHGDVSVYASRFRARKPGISSPLESPREPNAAETR